jgi:hypothetical protein
MSAIPMKTQGCPGRTFWGGGEMASPSPPLGGGEGLGEVGIPSVRRLPTSPSAETLGHAQHLARPVKSPSPPFRGEREGPIAGVGR